jgi:hypothetical protein
MKVGDMVVYSEKGSWRDAFAAAPTTEPGIIIAGPVWPYDHGNNGVNRWEIVWMDSSKTGWWDEFRLEVISESR